MFSKSKPMPGGALRTTKMPADKNAFSVIGSDVEIIGNIKAQGDLHIDGTVRGDISCKSLVIGETGHVHGAIEAEEAKVSGRAEGSVAAGRLTITATAETNGDISYDRISIEAGARTDGTLKRATQGEAGLTLVSGSGE